jgi:hypothetical protein
MLKYTKGIIRSPYSKDRQYNDQKQRNNMINIGLQNIKQKTNDWATRTPRLIGGELRFSEIDSISCSTFDIRCVTF